MAVRTLISVRRRLLEDGIAHYEEAWRLVRDRVQERSAHAWRFRSGSDARSFIEFIEFGTATDPRSDPAVTEALERLEAIAPGTVEEWTDADEPSP